jgi:hypothetical protein
MRWWRHRVRTDKHTGEVSCLDCDFTPSGSRDWVQPKNPRFGRYLEGREHQRQTNIFRLWDPDKGTTRLGHVVPVALGVAAVTVVVFVVVAIANFEPPPPSNTQTGETVETDLYDPPCGGIGDCNGNGIPDDVEKDIQDEQRAQQAEDYCSGSEDPDSCVEGVMNGDITPDYGPQDYPTQDYPTQDYPSYP